MRSRSEGRSHSGESWTDWVDPVRSRRIVDEPLRQDKLTFSCRRQRSPARRVGRGRVIAVGGSKCIGSAGGGGSGLRRSRGRGDGHRTAICLVSLEEARSFREHHVPGTHRPPERTGAVPCCARPILGVLSQLSASAHEERPAHGPSPSQSPNIVYILADATGFAASFWGRVPDGF